MSKFQFSPSTLSPAQNKRNERVLKFSTALSRMCFRRGTEVNIECLTSVPLAPQAVAAAPPPPPTHGLPRNLARAPGCSDLRPAVAKVLDSVSWEILGLLLGSLEESSSPSSLNGSDIDPESPFPAFRDGRVGSRRVSREATLSERLVLEMAEIFSPKELHVIALEHLHAYSGER